jgi:serine/threonine protein kinase
MLRLESVMQRHPDRITYMARAAEDGALVAVKCYACCEHRDSEASFYRTLASLQGAHIPRYLGSGLLGDACTARRFALILSWVGDDLEGGEHPPPPSAWKQAREALLQMHALGVVHGDLEPRNVTYDQGSGRLFFCDFSHALTSGALGPAKFAAAHAKELESFDRLVVSATPDSAEEVSLSLPLLNLGRAAAPAKGIDFDLSVGGALQAVTPRLPSRHLGCPAAIV